MLDSDTKNRIDTARNILVGKLPNPQSQVEQITIALIYKFMDDMDSQAEEFGGERTFFSGEFERYGWGKLMDVSLGGQEILNRYAEAIEKMKENQNVPQLFRDIFKNAFLPYRDPETLRAFLKKINEFTYDHSERLGDAFEYLLSIMDSQGDAGQFRTPRHIIDFMVKLIEPQKGEKILDPACGTAGFLISAYKHIMEANSKDGKPGAALTPDERTRLMESIEGYDISPDMVRLSLVNLYLHSFPTPKIREYDTLTSEEHWNDYADVIMANPPFMSPKGGIRPHKRFSVESNRSEVLFVDYIMEHLTANGRAAVIVPEGIIFQSGTAYKALRKKLVEEDYLAGVISLPAGVFNPYSGVKTSILWLDRALAKKANGIIFCKIEHDGFDLGAQRRPNGKDDLPGALAVLKKFKKSLLEGQELILDEENNIWLVEKEKIAEGGEYNLSLERYKDLTNTNNKRFEFKKLGSICEFKYGKPLKEENRVKGEFPVFGSNGIVGYHNEYLVKSPFIVVGRKGSAGEVHYSTINGYPIDTTFYIDVVNNKEISLKFLFEILKSIELKNTNTQSGVPGLNRNDAYKIKIPIPPLQVQEEIVAEIEGYQKIIDGARMVVENYRPRIEVDPSWPVVKLGEVCDFKRGPFGGSLKKEIFVDDGFAVYEQRHAIYNDFSNVRYFINNEKFNEMKGFQVLPGDLIMSCSGTMGKVAIVPEGIKPGIINQALLKLTTSKLILKEYLKLCMDGDVFQEGLHKLTFGAAIQNVASVQVLKNIQIPLPNIDKQLEVVAQIEKEQKLIDSAKELIALSEEKIRARVAKVWGE